MNVISGWRKHRILWFVSAALLVVSARHLWHGFHILTTDRAGRSVVDLHMRWLEERYVLNGQNPYDVVQLVQAQEFDLPLPECTRDNHVDPDIGKPYHRAGGYPPWAFITAAPIVLPTPWRITTAYFALLNVVALTITFVWAYQVGRPHSAAGGAFLGAAALAIFAHYTSLRVGQYAIIINAFLIGVYWTLQKRIPIAAGVLLGLATLKPQISVLFALGFVVRKQWKALAAATAYLVLASLAAWAMTKTNPIEMLQQGYALAQSWANVPDPRIHQIKGLGYSSFSSALIAFQVDPKIATPLAAITGAGLAGVMTWLWRNASTLTVFAIAATIGRLWSYHHHYDDVMLVFLVVALGERVLSNVSIGTVLAFCFVGLSLWPADTHFHSVVMQIAQMSSWLFGLAVLLAWEPRSCQADETHVEDRIKVRQTVGSI